MLKLILASCMLVTLVYGQGYQIGVGRYDITGPSVEITFMGYAIPSQRGEGIHLRQFSRAFIVDDGNKRVVFVCIDAAMVSHPVKREVVAKLQRKYGDLYSYDNIIISGTHTHSAPGGFLTYLMYDMPNFGFVRETFEPLIDGIYRSIVRAHDNVIEGKLTVSEIEIHDVNINRSPLSYLENPEEERAQYDYNTDRKLTQIQFLTQDNQLIGAINWYAVHPTSMNNTNHLISSDNLGYASILLENEMNPNSMPGKGSFVGAFCSANLGDASPNIRGPKCQLSGNPCDALTSSCPAGEGDCVASGPGRDIFESTKIIAERMYKGASQLLQGSGREIRGEVKYIHQFVDMSQATATYYNSKTKSYETVHGCLPAMGYSFAAGTTDGPGAFDFEQGTTTDNALWNFVRDFIAEPSDDVIQCQAPKPILLFTGGASFPYDWQPKVVPTQLLQIGDVAIVPLPGEYTTMSGRRIRNGVRSALLQATNKDFTVILAGLSNQYTSYVATPEEYQIQRYEGASTIYGPHTCTIYVEQFQKLAESMSKNEEVAPGPLPPNLDDRLISLQTGVLFDGAPIGRSFGSVRYQPRQRYSVEEEVHVKFVAGNPRNNLMREQTFLTVEKLETDGSWSVVATDAHWETKFHWERTSTIFGFSDVDIYWQIPADAEIGVYRICHFGYSRALFGNPYPYQGCTARFDIG